MTIRTFADDLGVGLRTVSKWEAGGTSLQPRPELQAALDTLLRRATSEERARFHARRESTSLQAFSSIPPSLGAAADESAAFAMWWEQTTSGAAGIDVVHAELGRLAHDYLTGVPDPVIRSLLGLRANLFETLRTPQSPSVARDLHLFAGYACVLLGWLSGDLGQPAAAGTHAAAADLFARTSGSPELAAWVQTVRSKTAFWSHDYGQAATEAALGLKTAPATSVRVLLAAQAADAWSAAGNAAAAEAALADVSAARDACAGQDFVGGLLSFSPAREANYVSGIYQQLGQATRAVALAEDALRLSAQQPVRSYATEAQIRLNQVEAFLDSGDLDAAVAAIGPVLALPVEQRLTTLTTRIGRYSARLAEGADAGHPLALQLQDDIALFTDSS